MSRQTIQIFEHERLTTYPDEWGRKITPRQLELLCLYNDNNQNKYYTVIRNGVKFNQYVGVIQIGNLTIEILPKADKTNFSTLNDKEVEIYRWRKVLLKMLQVCGIIKVEAPSEANLKKRHNSLLDLYFDIYLKEVENLLRTGLIKKYRGQSGNVYALKGRLKFSQNIQQNLIHQERFFTEHQTYDYQNLLNKILIKGLRVLKSIANDTLLIDRINRVLFCFPEIEEILITESNFSKVNINRQTEKYSEALKVAKMIILNYSPDIIYGQENMLALLFNMNDLWEKFIFRMLKRGEDGTYTANYHQTQNFWLNRRIEPDIVIVKEGITYIVDTKWKIVSPNNPSDNDLKQMYAYNMYWDAPKSMLLYPKTSNAIDSDFGKFHKGREGENLCKVGFVNVFDNNNQLNQKISAEIIEKLN